MIGLGFISNMNDYRDQEVVPSSGTHVHYDPLKLYFVKVIYGYIKKVNTGMAFVKNNQKWGNFKKKLNKILCKVICLCSKFLELTYFLKIKLGTIKFDL